MVRVARRKAGHRLPPARHLAVAALAVVLVCKLAFGGDGDSYYKYKYNADTSTKDASASPARGGSPEVSPVSFRTPLAYGTKSLKERTGELVATAISEGFRHIVTGGHHSSHNETGVGHGWKASGLGRSELFLQTCFVPFGNRADFAPDPLDPEQAPESIEEQVRLSVSISLKNLQTDYLDALVFHNNKAKRWADDEIRRAWKVFEELVDEGTVKHLGMTSVHDPEWFETFWNQSRIKPEIVQNRFHSNRQYDVNMQEVFRRHNTQVQRFWLLNGSSRGGRRSKDEAEARGVTPAQLMLGFVMSMGSQTCLVGTKTQQHMRDDVEVARCYPSLFWEAGSAGDTERAGSDEARVSYADKLGMKQPGDRPLPGPDEAARGAMDYRPCRSAAR
ncbi:unnamed protein product [Pseudo-nitzschia multistriata]|uniref:NADP-dependent oxidoreductase domain-containing protein n=1 Tax=Pseudo-nitzschia multistriata TaxID=183589 RepID=A0A448ZAK8_9STRA|nr:unnamed protein product [Pseudo-nitzschia multistriata]